MFFLSRSQSAAVVSRPFYCPTTHTAPRRYERERLYREFLCFLTPCGSEGAGGDWAELQPISRPRSRLRAKLPEVKPERRRIRGIAAKREAGSRGKKSEHGSAEPCLMKELSLSGGKKASSSICFTALHTLASFQTFAKFSFFFVFIQKKTKRIILPQTRRYFIVFLFRLKHGGIVHYPPVV